VLLLYAIVAGLLVGRLAGGRVRNLEHLSFAWWPLAIGGLVVQAVLFAGPVAERVGPEGPVIYVASTLAVMAALLRNLMMPGTMRPGLAIIALGATLNLVPILANGGAMPSAPEAWLALNGVAALPISHFSNGVLIGPDTLLPFLGDIFVWPRPLPLANVFSLGDAVIAVGAVVFLVAAMRAPQTRPARGDDAGPVFEPPVAQTPRPSHR
jgi:hypothetical protein